ncbi:MAG: hypothetical protein ACKOA8_05875, partial [Deltaproteobacteria bacterium]
IYQCGFESLDKNEIERKTGAKLGRTADPTDLYVDPFGNYILTFGSNIVVMNPTSRGLYALRTGVFSGNQAATLSRLGCERIFRKCVALVLSVNGSIILHGNVVSLKTGEAIGVLGESGFGKSTLTLALVRAGATFLSDDLIAFDSKDGRLLYRTEQLHIQQSVLREMGFDVSNEYLKAKRVVRIHSNEFKHQEYYLKKLYQIHPTHEGNVMTKDFLPGESVYQLMKCAVLDPRALKITMENYLEQRIQILNFSSLKRVLLPRKLSLLKKACDLIFAESLSA